METSPNVDFQALLNAYEANLAIMQDTARPNLKQIFAVLFSRDAIAKTRQTGPDLSEALLERLVELDDTLHQCERKIANHPKFVASRQTVNPPEQSWWWFFSAQDADSEDKPNLTKSVQRRWFEYDWLWNTITVACLVGAGSYAATTAQAFSDEDLDLLQKFTTISQGAGLVLVTGGTLTKQGQQVLADGLSKMNIPPKYQAEVTCGFAVLLFTATWGLHQSIPSISQAYYRAGLEQYDAGNLNEALEHYERAEALDPENTDIQIGLGNLNATFALYSEAEKVYRAALGSGAPEAFNGLGRVLFRQATSTKDIDNVISIFRLAISKEQPDSLSQSIMYGHLGFAYIRYVELGADLEEADVKKHYREANLALRASIAIEKQQIAQLQEEHNLSYEELQKSGEIEPGMGMAYCYMGILYDKLEAASVSLSGFQNQREETADFFWNRCQERALPASLSQYKDITTYGTPETISRVEVDAIVRTEPKEIEAEGDR